MQTNDCYEIELLVLDRNTLKNFILSKQKSSINLFRNNVTYKLYM